MAGLVPCRQGMLPANAKPKDDFSRSRRLALMLRLLMLHRSCPVILLKLRLLVSEIKTRRVPDPASEVGFRQCARSLRRSAGRAESTYAAAWVSPGSEQHAQNRRPAYHETLPRAKARRRMRNPAPEVASSTSVKPPHAGR